MRKVAEHIYERGRRGMLYVRRRIPNAVRLAYPLEQTHITTSLGTSDLRDGKVRARVELQRIDAEFERKKQQCDLRSASMAPRNVATLTDDELQIAYGQFLVFHKLANKLRLLAGDVKSPSIADSHKRYGASRSAGGTSTGPDKTPYGASHDRDERQCACNVCVRCSH